MDCPCKSGKTYEMCCKPLHDGSLPDNALQLMRSRYSAYALGNPDYIMRTTHRSNPHFNNNPHQWKKDILAFCKDTQFQDLTILEFIDGPSIAYVTFIAHLTQNGLDASFEEKSLFEKVDARWLYKAGELK